MAWNRDTSLVDLTEADTSNEFRSATTSPVQMIPAVQGRRTEVYEDNLHDSSYESNVNTETLAEVRQSIRNAGLPKPDYWPPKFDAEFGFNVSERDVGPMTYEQAISSPNVTIWKKAMKSEIDSLNLNETWELVDLPKGKKPISNKWIFKTKVDANGNVDKHKARLVVRGYSQVQGIDYNETFSPVVRYTSIRFLLAMAAKLNLNIRQMDAVTAFLNGELEEEIYMRQPKGFEDGTKRVCRFRLSLYGLKQSSRVWNQRLNKTLIEFGLKRSEIDQCVYYHMKIGKKILIVAIYVDDLLIFSNDKALENQLINEMCKSFEMKDMGEASSVLGVRIQRDSRDCSI